MELDDLKQSWNEQFIQSNQNTNIMELIQHKSSGPVAALKRGFKKRMRIMLLMPLFIFITNAMNAEGLLRSIIFWSYVLFCVLVVIFFYFNYRIATRMEAMEGNVKENLEQQIQLLEKRHRWKIIGLPIATLFFILLFEVVPYIQYYKMLNTWHNLSLFIRFGAYASLLLFQYFMSRTLGERTFGAPIKHLKELLREMRN